MVQLALARPREKKGKESWLGLLYGCPNNNNHNDDLKTFEPWLVWLSGLSTHLQTTGSLVQFPVRAPDWVAGQVPSEGHMRGNHTLIFLSLSFSLPFHLKISK